MKYFYALSDSFTGDYPEESTSGFVNTSEVIAFESKRERDQWVWDTNLLKAKPLTRNEAIRYAEWKDYPQNLGLSGDYFRVKAARIIDSFDYIALKYSAN